MSEELCFLPIAEASRLIRAGKLSPVDVTKAVLDRIERHNAALAAFILVRAEEALAEARLAEAEIAGGGWKGPLHGIPIAVKDIVDTANIRTTGNSALFATRVPVADAPVWARLAAAGAILIGKTATWEFATGGTAHDLPWPPARNPWDFAHDTGGSSSGSGAAVAAGLAFGAVGTDTSGSVRIPAAWCGIAGLKPTYGLVPGRGIMPLSFSLDQAGPMCRTSLDCAIMLQAMAGFDPQDPTSANVTPVDYAGAVGEGIRGLRVGVPRSFLEERPPATDVARGIDKALAVLAEAGAVIRDVSLPPLSLFDDVCVLIARSEAFAFHRQHLRETPDLYGRLTRARLMAGALISASDYVDAQRQRRELIAATGGTFGEIDVMVLPAMAHTAPLHGAVNAYTDYFTRPFSVTGHPAHAVPIGLNEAGLPLAMQIVARPFEDQLALRAGHVVEEALASRERPRLEA